MPKVIEFPDSSEREWRVYAKLITEWLERQGAATHEIDYVLEQMKPLYGEASVPLRVTLPADSEILVQELNSWFTNITVTLMKAIAGRDIELFRLRGP